MDKWEVELFAYVHLVKVKLSDIFSKMKAINKWINSF